MVEYNLGETTITQSMFPEDGRFRNMPVRLNGIVGVTSGDGTPYPVVIILHGKFRHLAAGIDCRNQPTKMFSSG